VDAMSTAPRRQGPTYVLILKIFSAKNWILGSKYCLLLQNFHHNIGF
jgi:hypothetical protein